MGQVLYGCARTTEATRRTIQNSQESLRTLAGRYGIDRGKVEKTGNRRRSGGGQQGLALDLDMALGNEEFNVFSAEFVCCHGWIIAFISAGG